MQKSIRELLLPSLAIFAAYLATAKLGLMLGSVSTFATLVWPPTGIALAAVVIFGFQIWPALFLGAFLINLHTGAPFLAAAGIGFGNLSEALVGAYLLRKIQFSPSLGRIRDVLGLILFGAILSTLVSASIGVTTLWLQGIVPAQNFYVTWRAWWIGDMMGDLVIAPLLLVWVSGWMAKARFKFDSSRALEAAFLGLVLVAVSIGVFQETLFNGGSSYSIIYAIFPITTWAALRFNQRGSVTAIFTVSIITIWSTILGFGPFSGPSLSTNLFFLQTFQATLAVSGLILAAAVTERAASLAEARAALQSRDEFLAVASHELRTPLTVLYLHLQNLLRMNAELTPNASRSVISALGSATRLVALQNKLLDLTKIDAGKLTLSLEEVDLVGLTEAMVDVFSEEAKRSSCAMTYLPSKTPITGLWDRYKIEQVITNLISNAIKYGNQKPITIEVKLSETQANTAQILVKDSGLGISPEMLPKIFERFEREKQNKTIGGLGLGLYITRQIILEHGGTISVSSTYGEGSVFTVELPAVASTPA